MIKAAVIAFTKKGMELSRNIKELAQSSDYAFDLYAKFDGFNKELNPDISYVDERVSQWAYDMQEKKTALVFVSAMGIAVRAIAKGLENKLTDAPVIVIDELGMNVIPVVGGHVGGANEMALYLASVMKANPVITTATDLEGSFSVDLFAKENGLAIFNKDGIAKVSAKALTGKAVRLSIENYPPEYSDIVVSDDKRMASVCDILLCPKKYAVGIGCKKGTDFESLNSLFINVLKNNSIDINDVGAIASIDLKADEDGLIELSRFYKIPFITYTKEILNKAKGDYEESEFVLEKTGVGNVCERAAMVLTGNRGTIVQKKYAEDGMTIAIAKME